MATKKPQPAYLSAPAQDLNWDAAEAYLNQPASTQPEPSSSGVLRTAGDMTIKAAQGVIGIGESAVGLGSLATGGLAGEGMRAIGYDPKAAKAMLGEHLSDAQKSADAEVAKADGFVDTVLTALRNPRSIAGSVAESLPSTLMGMGITLSAARAIGTKAALAAAAEHGGLATAAGQKAGAEATKAALEQATGKLMWIGSGVEGAQSAGRIADQAQAEGADWSQYAAPSALAGIGTAAIGRGAGKLMGDTETAIIARAAGGSTAAGIAGKIPARIAKSMFSEGVLEEAPQSAWEQSQTNLATGKPWQEGMGNAAGMGLVTGAAMGGGTAIAQGRTPADIIRETETVPESGPLTRAANAATEQKALQLENNPDPLMAFPDGTVGKRAEVDAYINGLPENERMTARAKLYGYGPERVSQPEPIPQAPLALPGPDSAVPGGALLAGENGVTPETYGDRQAADAAARQREELGVATPRGEAPIEIQPPQPVPDAAPPAIQLPQPKPTGTFGAMDEFGQLMQAEKTDLSAQRAQATQAQSEYLAQQAARREAEIATVDASVEQREKAKSANARMSIIDGVLADPGIDGIANKKGKITADLKRAGYSSVKLSDAEVVHIDRHADLAQTLNTPDVLPSAPNEMPADIVPEKKASAPPAIAPGSGLIALPEALQAAADRSNDPTQFSKALNAAKIKIGERKPFMDAFKAQLKERGTSNDTVVADAADTRPGNADAVLGAGDLRGNRVAATRKTQAAPGDKAPVQDNPDANGQSGDGAVTHLNPAGKPFVTEFSAKKKLRDLKLVDTHAVVRSPNGGFVVEPLTAQAASQSADTWAADMNAVADQLDAIQRPLQATTIRKNIVRPSGFEKDTLLQSARDTLARFDAPVSEVRAETAKPAETPIITPDVKTAPKKISSGAQVARDNLRANDPFRAFLAENGVHPDDRADIGVDQKITVMTPGYGPIFKKSAPRMDILAQRALEAGHLTQLDIDSDTDNGGTGKLADMIRRAVGNKEVIRPDDVGAEATHGADAQLMDEAAALGINTDGKTLDQVYDAVMGRHADAIEDIDADIAFDANDSRINRETLSEADLDEIFGKQPESAGVPEETHAQDAGERSAGSGEAPGFALQGETAAEVTAREDQAGQDAADKQAADNAAARAERAAQDKKDIASRQDASADNFQLGQSAEESLSGQQDIFSDPVQKAKAANDALEAIGFKHLINDHVHAMTVTQGDYSHLINVRDGEMVYRVTVATRRLSSDITGAPSREIGTVKTIDEAADLVQKELPKLAGQKAPTIAGKAEDAPAEAASSAQPIVDFGEKIIGAKKDLWQSYKKTMTDALPADAKDISLSKHFPLPNYESLIDAGVDTRVLAAIKAMRDEIPSKPQILYKLRRWGDQVKALHDFAGKLLDGTYTAEYVLAEMRKGGLTKFADRIDTYTEIGYPAFRHADGYEVSGGWTIPASPGRTQFALQKDGRHVGMFDSRKQAIDALRERLQTAPEQKKATVQLDIYRVTKSGDIVIGKKVAAGKYIDLKGGFVSAGEARAYLTSNEADLLTLLEQKKDVRPERRGVNAPRIGQDYRAGEDVTPEKFTETLGFRGIQFGNYVEQKRRTTDLNNAYDAMLDLADILNLPPRALSLNGTLGLAFGARGSGGKNAASAHFEPDQFVINLTKTNGAGSLAHEIFHGIDNYFSRMRGVDGAGHITDNPKVRKIVAADRKLVDDDSVRPDVLDAFAGVVSAIRDSGMVKRSQELDARRSKDYWSTVHELAARAFESYVIDKAAEQGRSNDYLANIVSEDAHSIGSEMLGVNDPFPYPLKSEAAAINAAFDKLFATLKTKETDKGTALFDRAGFMSGGTTVESLKAEVDRLTGTWKNAPKISTVQSVDELPFAAPYDARGAYYRGQVWLVADNLQNAAEAQFVLFHETLGHAGLRGMFGDSMSKEMHALAMKNQGIRAEAAKWRANNEDIRGNRTDTQWRAISIEESLADMAGSGKSINGIGKFLAAFQNGLRAIGLRDVANWMESATNAEVMTMLAGARRYIEQGDAPRVYTGQEAKAYARSPESGTIVESPAVRNSGAAFSRIGDAAEMLRSAKTLGDTTDRIKSLFESDRKFGVWDRTIGTQFHKATKDADFKRVFDAFTAQTNDTAHYAIESERLAPDVLPRMDSIGDVAKAVMNSGARYKADLTAIAEPLFANIEGKKGVQQKVFSDAELRTDFGLNDKQILMYRQVRKAVDVSIDRLAQTTIASMGEAAGMDIKALKNLDLAATAQAVKGGTDDGVIGKNIGGHTKNLELHQHIDEVMARAADLQQSGYMPSMRFGQYAVTVTDPTNQGDPLHFEMFESQFAANHAAHRLTKEFPGMQVNKSVLNKELFAMFKGVSPETVELFAKFSGMDQSQAYQDYIGFTKSNRSSMQRMISRKGIAGFSEDVPRVLASFITSNGRQSALNMNGGEVSAAMASKSLARKGDVQQEAQNLHTYMANPLEEAQRLRGFMFMHFLGGSVASAMVNMTQPILQTAPFLAQYAGTKTAGIMASSARMATTGNIGDAALRAALDRAAKDGITEPQEIHQLMADASGGTFGSSLRARALTKAWGSFFALAESFNRRLTFLAAYQIGTQMGAEKLQQAGFADAYQFAGNAVIETQGLYAKQNRPNWARGAVGATLFTFKQFSISYIEFLSRLPTKQKVLALGILVLLAGVQGLPFADDLEDLIDTLGQSMGYNTNSKKALHEAITSGLENVFDKEFARDLSEVVTYGLSSGTAVDLHGRLGMSNLLPGTGLFKLSEKDKSREYQQAAGPISGILQAFQTAVSKAQIGEYGGALTAMAPVAVKNLAQGVGMATTGIYKDTRGRKVQDVDLIDSLIKSIGFQPQQIAAESRRMQDIMQDKGMITAVKSSILERWAHAASDRDTDGIQQARDVLRAWNESNPDSIIRVKPTQIVARVREIRMDKAGRFIKSMPKEMRARVRAEATE